LKDDETDITDTNHLIYAAATVITERNTKPGKKKSEKIEGIKTLVKSEYKDK
jgi:hypothetical protein